MKELKINFNEEEFDTIESLTRKSALEAAKNHPYQKLRNLAKKRLELKKRQETKRIDSEERRKIKENKFVLKKQEEEKRKQIKKILHTQSKNIKQIDYSDVINEIKKVARNEYLRQYLPYLSILQDHKTIITRNNTLIRVLKINGIDSSKLSVDEERDLFNIRQNFFLFLPHDVRVTFYNVRRPLSDIENDESNFLNLSASKISRKWNEKFKSSYSSNIYLVVSKNFPSLAKNPDRFTINLNAARKEFDLFANQIKSLLSRYSPVDLDNQKNHQLFRFFSYLINNYEFNSKSNTSLFSNFSLSDFSFDYHEGIVSIKNDQLKKFSKIIGVRVSANDQNISRILNSLNYEFTIVEQVKSYLKQQNIKYLENLIKSQQQVPSILINHDRIEEIEYLLQLVQSDKTKLLDYSFYIKVFAEDEENLTKAVSDIQNVLSNEGIIAATETIGIFTTFFATLPDKEALLEPLQTSVRARVQAANIADFIPLFSSEKGFKRSPFGESPIVDFKTVTLGGVIATKGDNYSFTFHQDDINDRAVGHTMIIGQTGTGKSTLAAFLLMNCLKFDNMKILAFDSLEGLKIPVKAFGGKYITVGKDSDLKLNPLKLPDRFENRNFQRKFFEILAGGVEEKEWEVVDEVIRQNYTLDHERRELNNLKLAFGLEETHDSRPSFASRMKKWISSGRNAEKDEIYAKFFNNTEDNLDFASSIVAFDMGDVLKDQDLLTPTSFYIFHKFSQVIDENPSPHVFFIDEMAKYLGSDRFNPHIITAIKESRKKNGIFVGCMQEASTLVRSKNGDEIISNLSTLIIFPNSKAQAEDYITGLGLSESEFEFVKNHPNPRHVLIKKKDGHSVIIDADLSIIESDLKLFSSKDTDRKILERLESEGEDWVEKYLEEVTK